MNNPDTFNPSEGGARQEMADRGADTQRLAHAIGRGRVGIRGVLAIMAVLGGAAALEARAEEPSAAASLCQIDQGPEGNFGWVLLKGKCDKDGLAEGYGEARSAIGSTYKGHYHKGKRHGKGVYMLADGAVFTGQWQEDNPVDEESVWSFKHPKYKTPNAMYVYAGQLEAKRTVFEAKMVYNHIIRTFPDSDVAVKATDRLAQLRQPEEKPAHKEAPPESGSDFPADIIATFDQLRPLLPKDDANPILPGNRQQAIAIVRRLVERYPNEADAHVLNERCCFESSPGGFGGSALQSCL